MSRHIVFFVAFLMMSVCPAVAGAWEYEFGGKVGMAAPAGGDLDDEGFAWGFYANREIARNIFLQIGYLRHVHDMGEGPNDFIERVKADLDIFNTIIDSKAEVNDLTLNASYRYQGKKWTPFISGGVGVYVWQLEVDGNEIIVETGTSTSVTPPDTTTTDDTTTSVRRRTTYDSYADFGLNIGGGITYKLSKEVALGGEVNYTRIYGEFDEGYYGVLVSLSSGF